MQANLSALDGAADRAFEELLRKVAINPHERESLLRFVRRAAAELPAGSRLIDVGAGDSPYRKLFAHLNYECSDWQHSVHPGARAADHIGPAHDLPVPDRSYDGVLCTQVLEHVPNPDAVVRELHRILRPGGRLYLTVPLAWELHEMPFDYYRYTAHGLARIMSDAGFEQPDIRPRNDCFGTLAQLLKNAGNMMGRYPDGLDARRAEAQALLHAMSAHVASFSGLDVRMIFPLGYSVVAARPGGGAITAPRLDRAAVGLPDARRFVTLCFASDVLSEPSLLRAYAQRFSGEDDATLVIYAPNVDPALAAPALIKLVADAGVDGQGSPDMIGLPFRGEAPDEPALAAAIDAVLATRPPWGAFSGVTWAHPGTLDQLRRMAAEPLPSFKGPPGAPAA